MSLLQVDELSIAYPGATVVSQLSFAIAAGESVGLVGESGSGKSQTALAIMGLLPAGAEVSGSIALCGEPISGADQASLNRLRATRMAMVFQDPMQALNPYLRIGTQLRLILEAHGIARGAAAVSRVVAMLERVGLPDAARQLKAYPHQLSGGMRQRVMIAAALIAAPELLIADEATTALDVTVQAQILELLESLREDTALLLISHDLGIVAGRCERMLVLMDGRLVESGPTAELFQNPQHAHTRALLAAAPRLDTPTSLPAAGADVVLDIEAAGVRYGRRGAGPLDAVRDVSLSLRSGETLAIVGESGSGKSSLVRAALGLVPLYTGRVAFLGEPLAAAVEARAARQRRDLQLVFQDPVGSLNPQLRVGSIVSEPLAVHAPELSQDARRERVQQQLGEVGLDAGFAGRYPHQLSGGQAQRVAIARALILKPKVLVCDEAVSSLDGSVREQILALLRAVQRDTGLAIVFISHDLAVVRSISHRVLVMYLGRLVEEADNATLFRRTRHPYSRSLLDAVPLPDPRAPGGRATLRGEVASLLEPPGGCAFHPRCRFAIERCATETPALEALESTRVACHRAAELDLS